MTLAPARSLLDVAAVDVDDADVDEIARTKHPPRLLPPGGENLPNLTSHRHVSMTTMKTMTVRCLPKSTILMTKQRSRKRHRQAVIEAESEDAIAAENAQRSRVHPGHRNRLDGQHEVGIPPEKPDLANKLGKNQRDDRNDRQAKKSPPVGGATLNGHLGNGHLGNRLRHRDLESPRSLQISPPGRRPLAIWRSNIRPRISVDVVPAAVIVGAVAAAAVQGVAVETVEASSEAAANAVAVVLAVAVIEADARRDGLRIIAIPTGAAGLRKRFCVFH